EVKLSSDVLKDIDTVLSPVLPYVAA
ncbi:MAG: hypothetical protein RLZZ535_3387, partial [Cyanobacteriota bacterium]